MTFSVGSNLGPYEVLSLIGAGGMGEVYQARDTRLDRLVAVKLLPPDVADRPDRRRRFETEARAIASLGHPHVCMLFDVGEQDGRAFLVMEYLEGETLDDRLSRGPLPAADVLRYASQIADALDHAHRARIVHRDLKPSNVMLTPSGAKLLDFGLARAPLIDTAGPSTASLHQDRVTAEGTLIGTFQYMAPEQLEGKAADARTDIFAFGTLLFEMATGRKAFEGKSQASLIAAIMTAHPPPLSEAHRPGGDRQRLPPALDHVAARCLAKNPDERWQTARDLKAELDWIAQGGVRSTLPARAGRTRLPAARVASAAVAVLLASWLAWTGLGTRRPSAGVTTFVVALPAGTTITGARSSTRLALSPDGRHLAFVATTDGRERLWVQSFDSTTPRRLEGTESAMSPFWSPDSQFIGFFARGEGQLKKIDASGGPPRTICAAAMDGLATWGRDGTILFTEFRKGIYRVAAEGGVPTPVTRVDPSQGELNHYWPSLLPDARRFLYTATVLDGSGRRATPIVYAASLDSADRKEITRAHSRMVYSRSGHVLYVQEGALLAQAFDLGSLRLTGEPVRIAEGLDYYRSTGSAAFSVSDFGGLAYHGNPGALELAWFDRQGKTLAPLGGRQKFGNLRISPEGERAAVEIVEPRLGTSDIWIYQLSRGIPIRLTTDLNDEQYPAWSPDGRRIMFGSDRGTGVDASSDFFAKSSDGMGDEETVFVRVGPQFLEDWSRDGRLAAYREGTRETGADLWILPLDGDRKPWPFVRSRFEEWGSRFSPDSAWVAFVSDDSATSEVYLAPLQKSGAKTRVSTGGGVSPRWRRDGRELFYLSGDGRTVMSVPVELTPVLKVGTPVSLFTTAAEAGFRGSARDRAYDVTPDGARFLFSVAADETASSRITVVLDWPALLRR